MTPDEPDGKRAGGPREERRRKQADTGLRIAVAGASGYIGGRLVPRLLEQGHELSVLTRDAARLRDAPWSGRVRIVEGALQDEGACAALLDGAEVAYYLVHGMSGGDDFEAAERRDARAFAVAARRAGVGRIVYLSGLHPHGAGRLSRHLSSRVEVGEILAASGVPAVVLQAGLVIGSGSASFEMVRHLSEVLPLMPAPRWVRNRIQPIAVRDALHYLAAAARAPIPAGVYDIGGPEVLRYSEMMRRYAAVAGLRPPLVLPLPVLTPRLAAQWVNLVTPIPRALAVPLVESLQHDCVVRDREIDRWIPRPAEGLTPYRRAVALALERIAADEIETSWSSAVEAPAQSLPGDPEWSGRAVFTDVRERRTPAEAERVWGMIERIGGPTGWYSSRWAWALRGFADKLVGGPGLRRGRRSRSSLRVGDALDWWRVEALEPGRRLLLRAEMRTPGRAWLELTVEPGPGGSRYRQRAIFFPHGLAGRLYWWAVLPFHGVVFREMARRITEPAGG